MVAAATSAGAALGVLVALTAIPASAASTASTATTQAAKAGLSIYGTLGSGQGAVRGPGGQIWLIAFDPPSDQGNPPGSQSLDVVNPTTLAVNWYGSLPPYLGTEAHQTAQLDYDNGAPAFDGAGHAFMIATAVTLGGVQAYYLVRYTPGPINGDSLLFKVPSACRVPEGLMSAGDGSVWLRCGVPGSRATPRVYRVTSTGAMKAFGLSAVSSIGAFAAGASGSMWAVGYNASGTAIGIVRYTAAGKESFFRAPSGYVAQSVTGNGSSRVIEIAKCGADICYLTVSPSGGLKKVAAEPGSAAKISFSSAPSMDVHGDVWTLNDGSIYKTGQYFLELTSANKVRAFPFTIPGGCGLLTIAGGTAASADGSVWVESTSNCTFQGNTSTAYIGALVRYLP